MLEWNKAFERICFKGAVVAKQQGDKDDFDTLDSNHASIRWFVGADVGFAIGPSTTDARSGEIIDADIGMSDVFGRGSRRQLSEDAGRTSATALDGGTHWGAGAFEDALRLCTYGHEAGTELNFALDVLEARGDLDPESPEVEAIVQAYVKDVIMHEVGHTLGLRHNFKASTAVTQQQLRDKNFGASNGIAASVMDYNPFNLPLAGEAKGEPNMTTLGPYDYWAIEYAYKPIDPAREKQELAAIAARSATDPRLVFGDDIDADSFGGGEGLDPLANRFDLGDDPLAFYARRIQLSRELWARVQARGPKPGDDPERLRRSLLSGFNQLRDFPSLAAKYVGGMYTSRDPQGTGGKPAFRPVEPAKQRDALKLIADKLFSVDSFQFKPEFLTSLAPNYVEWERRPLVNIPQAVVRLQTQALHRLLSAGTAQRLIELPAYLPEKERKGVISLNELYATVQGAVWSELKNGRDIDPLRRTLQREHLKRLQAVLTRPAPTLPVDAISLARLNATRLQADLRAALGKGGLTVENRAHLEDALALLTEALRATLQRG